MWPTWEGQGLTAAKWLGRTGLCVLQTTKLTVDTVHRGGAANGSKVEGLSRKGVHLLVSQYDDREGSGSECSGSLVTDRRQSLLR